MSIENDQAVLNYLRLCHEKSKNRNKRSKYRLNYRKLPLKLPLRYCPAYWIRSCGGTTSCRHRDDQNWFLGQARHRVSVPSTGFPQTPDSTPIRGRTGTGVVGNLGGAMDDGESPKESVHRETAEECGYHGDMNLKPLLVYKHPSGFTYHNFLAIIPKEFKPKLDWETQGFRWCTLDKLPKPLHPGLKMLNGRYQVIHSDSEGDSEGCLKRSHRSDLTARLYHKTDPMSNQRCI